MAASCGSGGRDVDRRSAYADKFRLIRKFNQSDTSFAFFDHAPLGPEGLRVMGVVEDMFYDQPKAHSVDRMHDELRSFVLRYFLRVSDYRRPGATPRAVDRHTIQRCDQ